MLIHDLFLMCVWLAMQKKINYNYSIGINIKKLYFREHGLSSEQIDRIKL